MKDLKTLVNGVAQHAPEALTSSPTDGADVDLQDYESAVFVVEVGAWTDGTFTYEFEHAPDDGTGSAGTYAAIADADLIGTEPVISDATNDGDILMVGYKGGKRFVRITCVVTGSPTTGCTLSSFVLRGNYRHQPTT